MKYLVISLCLCLFISASGQKKIQEPSETKDHKRTFTTRFGFKGGFNRSHIIGKELDNDKIGYIGGELYGGFFSETQLSRRLIFENELLFSWTNDYHFIELPLHLKYKFSNRWSIFAGPKLDFLVDDDNDPIEVNYIFKNFGISADAGIQFNITKNIFAELRHSKGLTAQVTDKALDINNAKRNTTRIGIGTRF